jgi:hypothetical protein
LYLTGARVESITAGLTNRSNRQTGTLLTMAHHFYFGKHFQPRGVAFVKPRYKTALVFFIETACEDQRPRFGIL